MGRSRYRAIASYPHFITCSITEWMPIFSKPELVAIAFKSLSFLQDQRRLILHGYVFMENHCHLIVSGERLTKDVGYFKSFTARSIVDWLKQHQPHGYWLKQLERAKARHKTQQRYQVWQEGCHPQGITSAAMLQQKLDYIHNNPVKRGYVDDPAHWRYSSYRNYMGQGGVLTVTILEV